MALSGISLNAATAIGVGSVIQFDKPRTNVTMQVTNTGSPTNVNADLEISLDGVTFQRLTGAGTGIIGGNSQAALFARANLTQLVGGTSPTVTAVIAAAD